MLAEAFNFHNYQFNSWSLPPLMGAIYFFSIGVFVYSKNPKKMLNISFGLMCLVSFIWQLGFAMMILSKDAFYPVFWSKFIGTGVVFIDLGFYLYTISLIGMINIRKYRFITCLYLAKSLFFGYLVIVSNLILADPRKHNFGYYLVAGELHPLFLGLFIWGLAFSLIILLKRYISTQESIKRVQLKYVFVALAIYSLACVDYIPMYLKVSLYPFGDLFVISFITILAYAIIRYRVMEIDTIVHRTIMWVLASVLIFLPIGLALRVVRPVSLARLSEVQLTIIIAALIYVYLYSYPKIQSKIDHVFRRRKYDYYQVLGEIGEKIGSELDINIVISRLFKELKELLYIRNGLVLLQPLNQEDYTEEGCIGYDKQPEGASQERPKGLLYITHLSQWLNDHKQVLEREQIEIDPQYESIKEDALSYMNKNMLELLIPIIMEDKLKGMLGIGKKENLQAYTAKDIELLGKMGRQLGVTMDNALHHEDIVEKGRMEEELKLGQEIQMNLLPRQIPMVPNLLLGGMMTPAKEIGGDYYDFISLPQPGEFDIVIGDVSGKGVGAGLLMAMVKASIYAFSQEETSPKQILLRTNSFMYQHIGAQKFMTMLYLRWYPQTRTFIYSSAGHEHILIYRSQDRKIEMIQSGGIMLGIMSDINKYMEDKQIQLSVGDKILLYTDGATEAENQEGYRLGINELQEIFKKHSDKPANDLMNAVKAEIYSFIGAYPQYDDITLVVLEAV